MGRRKRKEEGTRRKRGHGKEEGGEGKGDKAEEGTMMKGRDKGVQRGQR